MIKEYLNTKLTDKQKEFIQFNSKDTQTLLKQLDNSVITADYGIALPQLSKLNPKLVKDFTYLMYKLKMGTVNNRRNFARFEFNMTLLDPKAIKEYRELSKLDKMLMRCDINTYENTLVKRPDGIHNDGCPRPGMMLAAKRRFKLDTEMLTKYHRPIKQNLIKSIKKGIEKGTISDKFFADEASYMKVADYCLANYLDPDAEYDSECNFQDQRGRAVKKILKRVGNYISNKDFRAMLVMPTPDRLYVNDTQALDSIFLFIAELTGHKCLGLMESDKVEAGRQAYLDRELPRLAFNMSYHIAQAKETKATTGTEKSVTELARASFNDHHKELHELIWLERIYARLDRFYAMKRAKYATVDYILWDIPIEIDHSMSMAQIMGALTNDIRILESTNMIEGPIQDPWHIDNVRRNVAKAIYTPKLYGSGRSSVSLVKAKGLTLDKAEIQTLKQIEKEGRFSVMLQLRDLFITNSHVETPVVHINTGVSKFDVHVSKFKPAGYETIVTEAYNGRKFQYSFTKDVTYIPNYKAMRTFWHTGLIHHLDSDLMDHNLIVHKDKWILDIHDADILSPIHANAVRESAAKRLEYYRDNRHSIIANYRKSIGAISTKSDVAYMKLLASIKDAGNIPFHRGCMK